jgi:chromate transporter
MTGDGRTLLTLVLIFVPLSLVSVGGGPAVFAEIQQQAVVIQGWTSEREFAGLFAISRAAPGPGVLLITLLGWKAAGWLGALVASLAFFVPSSLLIFGAARIWNRYRGSAWHTAAEAGFAPIAVGLVFAGALAVLRSGGNGSSLAWAVALAVAASRIWLPYLHPLILLAAGAVTFGLSVLGT